jgi:N-acetylglutamate synthase-like GNAT family acetyltransferase
LTDISAIITITEQGEYPLDRPTLSQWIQNQWMYGIVITENKKIRGFSVAFFQEIPRRDIVEIQFLRVDNKYLRRGFGTRMLEHMRAGLSLWRKNGLSIDINEYNEIAQQFLMEKNGFVIAVMHEAHDRQGEMIDAFYTLRFPPLYGPNGYNDGTIVIEVDGEITKIIIPKRP